MSGEVAVLAEGDRVGAARGSAPRGSEFPRFPEIRPGDEDLRGVITNLRVIANRDGSLGRNPNEPKVRWFLEAGLRKLMAQFVNYAGHEVLAYAPENEFLGTLSGVDVNSSFKALAAEYGVDVGAGNRGQLTTLWPRMSEFQQDLLQYVFRQSFHDTRMVEIQAALPELTSVPFGQLVESLAIAETDEVTHTPELQLQLALEASFPSEPRVKALSKALYEHQVTHWAEIYVQILDAYDLQIQEEAEITVSDLAIILNAIVEGATLRRNVATELGVLSSGAHVAVKTIQLLTSQLTGVPWAELEQRTAMPSGGA